MEKKIYTELNKNPNLTEDTNSDENDEHLLELGHEIQGARFLCSKVVCSKDDKSTLLEKGHKTSIYIP